MQATPDLTIWAFTQFGQCQVYQIRNSEDDVKHDQLHVCFHGCVHDSSAVSQLSQTNGMQSTTNRTGLDTTHAIDLHVRGESDELPGTERYLLSPLDGDVSGGLKRIPKALAVENDQWVDWLDVSGSLRSWYEENGDVVAVYQV